MAYELLGDFLTELQETSELVRVAVPVDSALEVAEVTRRVARMSPASPALFFENVRGHTTPVITNLLGSRARICRALGVADLEGLTERVRQVLTGELGSGWLGSLGLKAASNGPRLIPPKIVRSGACQQVVKMGRDVNLWDWPALRSWSDETNPLITSAQIYTRDPASEERHVSQFPIQIEDRIQLIPHWNPDEPVCRDWHAARARQRQLPVAVVLGGDPATRWLASPPPGWDSLAFGGLLRGSPIELVKCRTHDLEIPTTAEIVIEGFFDADTPLSLPSPIGGQRGRASRTSEVPTLQVTAITHRANPLFPAMISGPPPSEAYWISQALERLYLPLLQQRHPAIVDVHAPPSSPENGVLFVSVRKSTPMEARLAMHAVWSFAPWSRVAMIVVVDDSVSVHQPDDVWFAVATQVQPLHDLQLHEGPVGWDDHTAATPGVGGRIGIDATSKLPSENRGQVWPSPLAVPPDVLARVTERWEEYGLGRVAPKP